MFVALKVMSCCAEGDICTHTHIRLVVAVVVVVVVVVVGWYSVV
jgi:hypothetical protein